MPLSSCSPTTRRQRPHAHPLHLRMVEMTRSQDKLVGDNFPGKMQKVLNVRFYLKSLSDDRQTVGYFVPAIIIFRVFAIKDHNLRFSFYSSSKLECYLCRFCQTFLDPWYYKEYKKVVVLYNQELLSPRDRQVVFLKELGKK